MVSRTVKYLLAIILLFSSVQASVVIEGVVVDSETETPVVGANVLIVGTELGTSTDLEGRFRFDWEGSLPVTLRISHIGYISRDINMALSTPLKIRLVPTILKGKEVTVVGERRRSQAEASTAMDVIDIEKIELQGARDVGSALRRISSVVINETSSGAQTVSIRGSNANEVAVYLDGIKINSANTGVADLSQIDLNALQRIEVLRGGNTYLFGQGNMGGVLNLETQEVSKNRLSLNWGEGLSFDDDMDLSLSGTGVLGPFGLGGRFSGRARAYEGRTRTSSLFNHLLGDVRLPGGRFSSRWYQLKNSLTYPSGDVALGDLQNIASFRYRGQVWRTTGWEFFGGNRSWSETNNFFDNLDQTLQDRIRSYRIAKEFRIKSLDAIAQLEWENQTFSGDRTFFSPLLNRVTDNQSDIRRKMESVAVVARWVTEGDSPFLRRLQVELSGRMDNIRTNQSEQLEVKDSEGETIENIEKSGESRHNFVSRRLGLRMEGLTNELGYKVFFSQGNNRRLPTLNDFFIKASTRFDSLRAQPLEPEFLNSTELNVELSFTEFLTTPVISGITLNGAYFRNNYDNKIGYMESKAIEEVEEPPFPYNEPQADIRGIEAGVLALFLENKLRFQINYTMLDIENPFIFPNRPGFRYVTIVDLDLDWIIVSYDFFKEGEQFVMGSSFGRLFEPRRNANLNITLRKKIYNINMSLSYTIRNLMSKDDSGLGSEYDILFFNYYLQYREIVTLRLSL